MGKSFCMEQYCLHTLLVIGGVCLGYRIAYERGEVKTFHSVDKKKRGKKIFRWAVLIAMVLFIFTCINSRDFRKMLLPGNKDVTEAAVVELVEAIRTGERFEEAITTFCREIIINAQS